MADTRCVNPEYQLDVDVMILEYLLYQSIRAHFKASAAQSHSPLNHDDLSALGESAERLLLAFDSFIRIFKHSHKDYTFTESTSFNISLLQLLVLVSFAKQTPRGEVDDDHYAPPSSSFTQAWHNEHSGFLNDRLRWVQLREILCRSTGTDKRLPAQTIDEDTTISSWTTFQRVNVPPNHSSALFSILNRFMALSAEVSQMIRDVKGNGNQISDKWIDLALETMLQTALSLLSPHGHDSHPNSDSDTNGHTAPIPDLRECFAFGFLPNLSSTNTAGANDTALLINDMFTTINNTHIENPAWTTARSKYLSEFRLSSPSPSLSKPPTPTSTSTPMSSTNHPIPPTRDPTFDTKAYTTRLSRLKTKYPYETFERNLLDCLESFFLINTSIDVSDKPVLVQIEEGKLEGMEGEEFERFLGRVGLVRDERGMFDFGLGLGGNGGVGREQRGVNGRGQGNGNGEGDRSRRRLSEVFRWERGRWRTWF